LYIAPKTLLGEIFVVRFFSSHRRAMKREKNYLTIIRHRARPWDPLCLWICGYCSYFGLICLWVWWMHSISGETLYL